ncbi:DUF6221 family protein [Streptomyces sp. NPDC057620]|uniref:DUF6221 family protein n=1 Tax=Streptomyces sp. NPDC057620 TaxID=3346185 RepID=UPI0036862E9D
MPDLHGWITQQIDHAAAIATEATPGPWHVTEYTWQTDFDAGIGSTPGSVDIVGHGYEGGGAERREDARHIALHDPAAVLRRCEADRKILAAHPYTERVISPSDGSPTAGFGCETCHGWGGVPEGRGACPTILALAEGYGPEAAGAADTEVVHG